MLQAHAALIPPEWFGDVVDATRIDENILSSVQLTYDERFATDELMQDYYEEQED